MERPPVTASSASTCVFITHDKTLEKFYTSIELMKDFLLVFIFFCEEGGESSLFLGSFVTVLCPQFHILLSLFVHEHGSRDLSNL